MPKAPPQDLMAGWLLSGSNPVDCRVGTSSDVCFRDKPSMELISTASCDDGFSTIMTRVSAESYRGKRVRFSAFVRTDAVKQWAGLWMRIDAGSEMLRFDNMMGRGISGNTDWTEYQVVLDVPLESTDICYGLLLCGAGSAWLADCELDSVDTAQCKATDVYRSCGVRFQTDTPTNLDFSQGLYEPSNDECLSGAPKGWFTQSSKRLNFEMKIDGNVANISSLNPGNYNSDWFALFQSLSASSYLNERIRLSGKIKCSDVEGHAVLWFRTDAGHKLTVTHDYMEGRAPTGTCDWAEYDCVIDVPCDCDNIYFGGLLEGNGSAWFKDFMLEVVPAEIPTTGASGSLN